MLTIILYYTLCLTIIANCLYSWLSGLRKNKRSSSTPFISKQYIVLLLGKQELVFRGHGEHESSNNRGNFRDFLACMYIQLDQDIYEHYQKMSRIFTGQSSHIQNDLIHSIADFISKTIDLEIQEAPLFSVQVDATTDITEKSISVRFVHSGTLLRDF